MKIANDDVAFGRDFESSLSFVSQISLTFSVASQPNQYAINVLLCVFRPTLLREQHYQYLKKGLRHLSDAYEVHTSSMHIKASYNDSLKLNIEIY